jgi:arylformamidase
MKIFDISTDITVAERYPGDPSYELEAITEIEKGDDYNTSVLHLPLHLGTHIDFPYHFFDDGKTSEDYPDGLFCGECRVASFREEIITGQDIENLKLRGQYKRLIIKGNGRCLLSRSAAMALLDEGIRLVGIDNITIGIEPDDYYIHQKLLANDCLILEGLDLTNIDPQNYELFCLPLKISGADASPCRAFLTYIDY